MIVAVIILLIIAYSSELHFRLSLLWLLTSWLLDKNNVGVPLHIVHFIGSVASVLEVKLILIAEELHLLLPRCTLPKELCLVTWLVLCFGRAYAIHFPNSFPYFVVIKVRGPLDFFIFIEVLLVSTHNCSRVSESHQLTGVRIYTLRAVDAFMRLRSHLVVIHKVVWWVDLFADWRFHRLGYLLPFEVAGILALQIGGLFNFFVQSCWSWVCINGLKVIPLRHLGRLKHGSFPALLNAIKLINILWLLPERSIAHLTFYKSVNSRR